MSEEPNKESIITAEATPIPTTSDTSAAPDTDGAPSADGATREDFRATTARFSASLRNLGSNIDNRFRLLERAKSVDNRVHVSDATKSTAGWWSNVNERYKIGATAAGVTAAVDEKLKVSQTAGRVGEGVRGFDEKHRISVRTMEAVSSGAEFLSNKIRGEEMEGQQGDANGQQQDGETATAADGTTAATSATTSVASEPVVTATAVVDPPPVKAEGEPSK